MRPFVLIVLLLLPLLAGAGDSPAPSPVPSGRASQNLPAPDLTGKTRLAVLPFDTPRERIDLEQYGAGTMDSLISALQNVPQFILVDRGRIDNVLKEQAFAQSGFVDPASAVQVGKLLQAQELISGSLQQAQDQLRLVANVTDVESGQVKDSQAVTGSSIFDLQDQLAQQLLRAQDVSLTAEQQQRITAELTSTLDTDAYAYYLKGRQAYLEATPEGFAQAIGWYERALAADPNDALAYAGLAETWAAWGTDEEETGGSYQPDFQRAYDAGQSALQLNPNLPQANQVCGTAGLALGRQDATGYLERSLQLNPNYDVAWYQLWKARDPKRDPNQRFLRFALQLNPDLAPARNDRGKALLARGRYNEAATEFRQALRANPHLAAAHYNLGRVLVQQGKQDLAIQEFRSYLQKRPLARNRNEVQQRIQGRFQQHPGRPVASPGPRTVRPPLATPTPTPAPHHPPVPGQAPRAPTAPGNVRRAPQPGINARQRPPQPVDCRKCPLCPACRKQARPAPVDCKKCPLCPVCRQPVAPVRRVP